jgi:hypothetical protein
MFFHPFDTTRPHLLGQAVDDLDAGEVAFVNGAVEGLAGESLLMDRAVRIAVEEAAEFVLQFMDPLDRLVDQGPGELLVGEPLAAFDRVHEVALDRVALGECDVVAALDHPGAAALAQEALDGDGDGKRRIGLVRVKAQRRARRPPEPRIRMSVRWCATVGALIRALTPSEASTWARRAATSWRTVSYRLPP